MGWYILVGEVSIPLFDSVLLSILWWFVLKLNQKDTQKQLPSRLQQNNNIQKKLDLPWLNQVFEGIQNITNRPFPVHDWSNTPPHPVPPPRNSRPYHQGLWKPLVSLHKVGYCWRKNSCTSWYGKFSIIYRVLYIPGGWPWDFRTINSMKPSFHFKGYL